MAMMTTESIDRAKNLHEKHQHTRDPIEVAREVNPDFLKIDYKGANRYYVHTEIFRSPEEAGAYLRKLRRIAKEKGFHNDKQSTQ